MHSPETPLIAGSLAALFVSMGVGLIAARHHHTVDCMELIHRLHPHQLRGITDLLDNEVDGRVFWRRTHGIKGLWKRWRNHTVLLQICQGSNWAGTVRTEDMQYILERAMKLSEASFQAFLFGLLMSCMPDMAARKGRRALLLYAEIAFRVTMLCSEEGAPLCASMLTSVL